MIICLFKKEKNLNKNTKNKYIKGVIEGKAMAG